MPTGLLLVPGPVEDDSITEALRDQGGPEWDDTVFRMVTGVDLLSLTTDQPRRGEGTAIAIASTGWWLRSLDDLAQRLSSALGLPVMAAFEDLEGGASGCHVARPDGSPFRHVAGDSLRAPTRAWSRGLSVLLELAEAPSGIRALSEAAAVVIGAEPFRKGLVPLHALQPSGRDITEREILMHLRGQALVRGIPWRPMRMPAPDELPPEEMLMLALRGPVRLPGPPRWALARSSHAVSVAQAVVDESGWLCLVPSLDAEQLYGSAVQIRQLAQLPTGSWGAVIHPRVPVLVTRLGGGRARVEPVERGAVEDRSAYEAAMDRLVAALAQAGDQIRFDEDELRGAMLPEELVAWQVSVPAEQSQAYLRCTSPAGRLELLAEVLETTKGGHGPQA